MKLMADGKAKQASKLLKGDDSMAAQLEGKKLNDEADAKNKFSIENERAFTHSASKLRTDYERDFKNALVLQNVGIMTALDMHGPDAQVNFPAGHDEGGDSGFGMLLSAALNVSPPL